jgi:hypothetical protein
MLNLRIVMRLGNHKLRFLSNLRDSITCHVFSFGCSCLSACAPISRERS